MRYPLKRLIGSLALVAVTATGGVGGVSPAWAARLNVPTSATPAAGLRVGLNALLSEHVYLAAAATNAALGGRQPEFEAAAAALDANSADVAKAIGSVYGSDAEKAFLPLWRKHIGMVVDYTAGAATQDRARQQKAVSDLVAYTQDLGAFLAGANPNLPKPVVAELVQHHVLTLKAVIDAQAARDQDRAFTALRVGAGHMQTIADPLADAIVKQFPDRFAGAAEAPAGALRTALNLALREHVHLAAAATGAALGGRARRQLGGGREGDRLGLRAGRGEGVPAALAEAHRHGGGLHGGQGHRRPGQAGPGGERAGGLHAGLRRLPRGGQSQPAPGGGGGPGEAPRGGAQGRDRRAGGQGSGAGLHGPAHRRGPHADDRRSAGGGDRDPVSRALLGGGAARHAPGRRARGATSLRASP
jgi:hypothetical protein